MDKWLAERYRIGLTDYRALTLVARAPEKELRVNDLAHRVGLNQSSATRLVSRLEGKGFAKRDLCEKDGRGVYAVITEQGEALVREVREPYEDRVRELIEAAAQDLPQLDAKGLARALTEVGTLIAS
ncbi:MarR family transcriptional regulator [Glycomyces sp. NPDC046736]|uniref:MarR family winged helix-turn-helix transcriptional regulator n=1 Tax=Glycomyces sp. NPDC046736 TaxID=3155615 RepID=UPI0033F86A0F